MVLATSGSGGHSCSASTAFHLSRCPACQEQAARRQAPHCPPSCSAQHCAFASNAGSCAHSPSSTGWCSSASPSFSALNKCAKYWKHSNRTCSEKACVCLFTPCIWDRYAQKNDGELGEATAAEKAAVAAAHARILADNLPQLCTCPKSAALGHSSSCCKSLPNLRLVMRDMAKALGSACDVPLQPPPQMVADTGGAALLTAMEELTPQVAGALEPYVDMGGQDDAIDDGALDLQSSEGLGPFSAAGEPPHHMCPHHVCPHHVCP